MSLVKHCVWVKYLYENYCSIPSDTLGLTDLLKDVVVIAKTAIHALDDNSNFTRFPSTPECSRLELHKKDINTSIKLFRNFKVSEVYDR